MPVYVNKPRVGFSNTITAANITKTLQSGTITPVLFQANTVAGSYLDHIRAKPLGTNVASVARIFLNNGQSTALGNNNSMIAEVSLPPTTASVQAVLPNLILPIKMALPASWNVHVTIGTAVAAGWTFSAFGGDY